MEAMLFLLVGIYLLGVPVMLLVALSMLGGLREDVDEINRRLQVKTNPPAKSAPQVKVRPPVESIPTCEPASIAAPKPVEAPKPSKPAEQVVLPPPKSESPSAMDVLWSRIEDWFCVRGDFAPKGMTREFAVATRWLVRAGGLLLVGAIAYFMVLAINKGWIGPAQRVYGMMFWGVVGAGAGTWIKVKKSSYAILGEVVAALGLVALYLSFGLGHRYFAPPVIGSFAAAFAGLVAVSVAAAVMSVRLRSLTIAALGLVGGLLVPMITRFSAQPVKTDAYLILLVLAACVVAHLRRWTALGFAAAAASFAVFTFQSVHGGALASGLFLTGLHAAVIVLALVDAPHRSRAASNLSWAFAALSAAAWLSAMACYCFSQIGTMRTAAILVVAAVAHGALAWFCRGRGTVAVVLFNVMAVACAAFAISSFLADCKVWMLPAYGLFSAMLAELDARTKDRTFGVLALVVLVLCAFYTVSVAFPLAYGYGDMTASRYTAEFGMRIVRLASLPVLLSFLAWRLGREGGILNALRRQFIWGAAALALAYVSVESHFAGMLLLPTLKGGLVTLVWAALGAVMLTAGIVCRLRTIRFVGLALWLLAVIKVLLVDTSSLATPARVAVFASVGLLFLAGAFLYLRFKSVFKE